jgi:hypothetical protein
MKHFMYHFTQHFVCVCLVRTLKICSPLGRLRRGITCV